MADQRTPARRGSRRGPRRPGSGKGGQPPQDTPQSAALRQALAEVGVADAQRLERRVDGALRRPGPERGPALERLEPEVEAARARLLTRRESVPAVSYPPELPVSGAREEIADAIRDHQVVVVAGETGSGKTTQLPKICLELGRGARGMIGHTQPRRIAARAVAERVAEELAVPLGEQVGYAVRFTDRVSDRTLVSVVTDGILLAEVQRDPLLSRYDTVIIDEAHERSLNIDFLLGILHRLLPRRPDLKLIITSATIDPRRFADHFADVAGEVPVIEVSGRTFPVEVRYRPLVEDGEDDEEDEDDDAPSSGGRAPARAAREPVEAICDAVRELAATGPGDVLVFLPGEREIRETTDAVARMQLRGTEVLPLYARLSGADQHRVFSAHAPGVQRRVVLSTNVAETSLTVPGIRYVVDAGLARVSRYSARLKVQRLPVEPVSQASANQRSGRCGRVAEGVAIRLYSESDYESRPRFTDPEILRTSLASVILQMAALGLGRVEDFPFVDPPDRRQVADGLALLTELGALETGEADRVGEEAGLDRGADRGPAESRQLRLTPVGRRLAKLPLDPRLARMVLEADRNSCVAEVLVIAAALSVQDPRERPVEHQQAADAAHARFRDERSDLLTLLALWRYLHAQQETLSSSAFRRMCKREFLSWLRVREWQDVHRQLRSLTRSLGVDASSSAVVVPRGGEAAPLEGDEAGDPADTLAEADDDADRAAEDVLPGSEQQVDADRVHASVLAGFLSSIGMRDERRSGGPGEQARGRAERPARGGRGVEYLGARGARFALWPGSVLARKPPSWVMAAELVETSRLWARGVAAIQPEWVEALAGHLVRRTYSEPHWSKKRGSVVASERVLLHGLPLVAGRTVAYGRIDPVTSRDLFIRHALVEGDWVSHHRFLDDNRALLEEAEDLEHRTRTRGLVVDEEALVTFYDERVPADVVSGAHFDRWWKAERRRQPDLLTFDPAALLADAASGVQVDDYPLTWRAGELDLRVSYRFAPGEEDDGATVHVPLRALAQLDPEPFAWQVPGLRHELVTALVRGLPKAVRRHLAPAPDRAEAVLAVAGPRDGALLPVLSRELERLTGTPVPVADWDPASLPDHLRVRFVVEDDGEDAARRRVLGEGRDLLSLRRELTADVRRAVSAAASDLERAGARDAAEAFSGGALPEEVSTAGVAGYPALTDEGDAVAVRVYPTAAEARVAQRAGTRRLLRLELPEPGKDVVRRLSNTDLLVLARSPHGSAAALLQDCWEAVLDDLVRRAGGPPTDPAEHAALRERARAEGPGALAEVVGVVVRVLRSAADVEARIAALSAGGGSGLRALAMLPGLADARAQLSGLVPDGFVAATGRDRLPDLQRYLQGLLRRLEALPSDPARDRDRTGVLERATADHDRVVAALPAVRRGDDDVREVRWMLEELRVSLFAQGLGTRGSVSTQRIERALAKLPRVEV